VAAAAVTHAMAPKALEETFARAFREHERFLWGLCYRMTGCAADAEDLVQETFVRAMERPPARMDQPLRPWLVRVAMNLARDALRKRRRTVYTGPWLPSPIDTGAEAAPPAVEAMVDGRSTEGRYDLLESVSFAFLLALEALTPQQRAVLLLRDVFDYSVAETADLLGLTQANVKTSLHRARRAMASYDKNRMAPSRALQDRAMHALARLMDALGSRHRDALQMLLADNAVLLTDGGGEFRAARKPIRGAAKIAKFFAFVRGTASGFTKIDVRTINGLPAVVCELADALPGVARRFVLRCEVDDAARITAIHTIQATRKLSAIRF